MSPLVLNAASSEFSVLLAAAVWGSMLMVSVPLLILTIGSAMPYYESENVCLTSSPWNEIVSYIRDNEGTGITQRIIDDFYKF